MKSHRKLFICSLSILLLVAGCGEQKERLNSISDTEIISAMNKIRPEAICAHTKFLADDLLEGRGSGTRGYQIAANYVAVQFEAIGLEK